jgi:hypothetical protein
MTHKATLIMEKIAPNHPKTTVPITTATGSHTRMYPVCGVILPLVCILQRMSYEMRFLTNADLACNEQCLLCGVSFTVIRDYALHFEKCKKAANPVKNKSVLKAAQNAVDRLQTETRQKLNELRESRRSVDRIDTGPETIGTKRKADFSDHPSQRHRIQTDNSTLMPGTSFAQAEATTSRPSMDYLTDTQFTFPRNPAPRPADASWNTYGTANDEGSLGNIPVPIMYDLEEGLGSLGGIQTQGIYPNVREGDAGFDAPILLMMSSPQYWNPR